MNEEPKQDRSTLLILAFAFLLLRGGDSPSPVPNPGPVTDATADIAEQMIRDYASGLAVVYERAADENRDGAWIQEESKAVRLRAVESLNRAMAERFSPETLREAAAGVRRVLK